MFIFCVNFRDRYLFPQKGRPNLPEPRLWRFRVPLHFPRNCGRTLLVPDKMSEGSDYAHSFPTRGRLAPVRGLGTKFYFELRFATRLKREKRRNIRSALRNNYLSFTLKRFERICALRGAQRHHQVLGSEEYVRTASPHVPKAVHLLRILYDPCSVQYRPLALPLWARASGEP